MGCHLQNLSFSKKNYLYHEPYKQSVVVFCFVSMNRYILIMYSIELLFHCLIIKCRRIIGFQSAHYSFYARFGHGSNTFSPFWKLLNVFMFMFGPTYDDFFCIIYNMYKSITPVEKSRFPKFWTLYNRWFEVIIINYINVTSNDVSSRIWIPVGRRTATRLVTIYQMSRNTILGLFVIDDITYIYCVHSFVGILKFKE